MIIRCKECGTLLDTSVFAYMKECGCGLIGYDSMEGTTNVRLINPDMMEVLDDD